MRKGLREIALVEALLVWDKNKRGSQPRRVSYFFFFLAAFLVAFFFVAIGYSSFLWNLPLKVVDFQWPNDLPNMWHGQYSYARYCGYILGMSTKIVNNFVAAFSVL